MRYEWDEKKRQTNLEKHGLDFIDAPLVLEAEEKAVFPARSEQESRFLCHRASRRNLSRCDLY